MTAPHPELAALLHAMADGDLSPADRASLNTMLRNDPSLIDAYLDHLALHGLLRAEYGSQAAVSLHGTGDSRLTARNTGPREALPARNPRFSIFSGTVAAAAAILIVACGAAIWLGLFNRQSEIDNRKSPSAPIATVLDTTPGSTLVVDDTIVNSGDDIRSGTLSLDAGSADFRLGNGVTVTLRGQTQLTVHSPMSASIARGSATFDCPPAAKGYTVHLPDGARIVDLGTAFTLAIGDDREVALRVTEGRVALYAADAEPLTLDAGGSARVIGGGLASLTRRLATVTYDWARAAEGTLPASLAAGRDGWTAAPLLSVRSPHLVSGQDTTRLHTTTTAPGGIKRLNDAHWSLMPIHDTDTLTLEFNVRTTGQGEIGFIDAAGKTLFAAGSHHIGTDTGFYIRIGDSSYPGNCRTQTLHATEGVWRKLRLTVDLAAFDGDAAGTLEVAEWDSAGQSWGDYQPTKVAGVNLGLRAAGVRGSDIAGLSALVRGSNAIGNPTITTQITTDASTSRIDASDLAPDVPERDQDPGR